MAVNWPELRIQRDLDFPAGRVEEGGRHVGDTSSMGQADMVVDRLADSTVLQGPIDYAAFVNDVEPLARAIEREFVVETGHIRILFAETPTAADLARSVDETDRNARRVAAAFERDVRPERLSGRGVRLVPTGQGLRVERADPGSLDVMLLLGGLYQAITSQPLSFALNLAALLSGGKKAVVRAVARTHRQPPREITISLPVMPVGAHDATDSVEARHDEMPPPPVALVRVPASYATVRVHVTSADGTSIEVDCAM